MRGRQGTARLLVTALAATVAAGAVFFWGSGEAVHAQLDPATRALLYLQTQQSNADGSLNKGDFFSSELYAIGAAAAGYDPNVVRNGAGPSVIDFLNSHAASACPAAADPQPSAGRCGALIQAVVAAGKSPHAFATLDLVSRLNAYFNSANGGYGDHQAFTQALALQGLVAAGASVSPVAVTFVENAQDTDGGWNFTAVKNDPNNGSDTNSTAMLLMALDAAGDHTRDAPALQWLHAQQNADGGFSFQATTPASPSDPDSTALVVQAIIGAGQDPAGCAWSKSGHTPYSELIATQDASGGYAFPGNPSPDAFTTAQVPPALDGVPLPVPFDDRVFYQPGTLLPAAATTPTPAPSPTATPCPSPTAGVESQSTPGAPPTGASNGPPGIFGYGLLLIATLSVGGGAALRRRRKRVSA
jgi:hypothetical protein